jgi:hypothetical protein
MQLFLEVSNKLWPSIGHDRLWNSMQKEDVSNVDPCLLLSCEVGMHGYKLGRLGEAINSHPYLNLAGNRR